MRTVTIDIKEIRPMPKQPRQEMENEEYTIDALAESIRLKGLLEPLVVFRSVHNNKMVHYIISGERRYRAHLKLGLAYVECVIVSCPSFDEAFIKAVCSGGGKPLTQAELANSVARIWSMETFASLLPTEREKKVAAIFSRSSTWVRDRLALDSLDDSTKQLFEAERGKKPRLALSSAKHIAALPADSRTSTVARIAAEPIRNTTKSNLLKRAAEAHTPKTYGGTRSRLPNTGQPSNNDRMRSRLVEQLTHLKEAAHRVLDYGPKKIYEYYLGYPDELRKAINFCDRTLETLQEVRNVLTEILKMIDE